MTPNERRGAVGRALLCALCALLALNPTPIRATAQSNRTVVILHLHTENDTGETGTAVLSALGEQTRVRLTVAGEPAGDTQPANIHAGACGGVEAVRYVLHDVVNGRSTTLLAVSLERLARRHLIVNVQDSIKSLHAAKDARDVSCGGIP